MIKRVSRPLLKVLKFRSLSWFSDFDGKSYRREKKSRDVNSHYLLSRNPDKSWLVNKTRRSLTAWKTYVNVLKSTTQKMRGISEPQVSILRPMLFRALWNEFMRSVIKGSLPFSATRKSLKIYFPTNDFA